MCKCPHCIQFLSSSRDSVGIWCRSVEPGLKAKSQGVSREAVKWALQAEASELEGRMQHASTLKGKSKTLVLLELQNYRPTKTTNAAYADQHGAT